VSNDGAGRFEAESARGLILKILLTGSNGFTGRHFAELAHSLGHVVMPLVADLTSHDAVMHEVLQAAPDSVMHLAAISFVGHSDDNAFYAVNVIGTTNLLAALAQLKRVPDRVVLASSANIYGNCEASPIREIQLPAPVNHYAMSKLAMEHMARTYMDRLPLVISRPFNYTGPGQAMNFIIPKLVDHFARRAPTISLGNLHVEREFNDVQEVCSMYAQLLQFGEPGETYNICSGQTHSLLSVIDTLKRISGHQIEVVTSADFVRANEVNRLCGNPARLQALMRKFGASTDNVTLEDTLQRMLASGY
jgi:nucleoside-diphosphate-sugar epimerase